MLKSAMLLFALLVSDCTCALTQQNPIVVGGLQFGNVLYPNSFDALDVTSSKENQAGIIRLFPNGTSFSSLEFYQIFTTSTNFSRMRLDGNFAHPGGYTFLSEHGSDGGATGPIFFRMDATDVVAVLPTGNVGIGTVTPTAQLEVNGNFKLTSGSGASVTYADGTVQSTAWNGTACGGDYAESVDVVGERNRYEPGDLMVIDPSKPGSFVKSVAPYSTLVSGIYSTKPGFTGRRQAGDPRSSTTEVPMAMVGIVPTKVTAENGPIAVGDLLVSSSLAAHAMKGTDPARLTGAVVGKALGRLDSGTGVIEVLVSLQ